MINKRIIFLAIVFLILHYSCEKTNDLPLNDIVINEVMPVNSSVVQDQDGEYDDWIELFNTSDLSIDISGYYLSDKKDNYSKWRLPEGTSIQGKGFLIIWADDDTTQIGLHANFKLSSLGETVILSEPDGSMVDQIEFPGQTRELSYSRNPDGSKLLKWQNATFNSSNNQAK